MKPTKQAEHDRLLLLNEMAQQMRADEKTVYRRIQAGKLKAFKEGGRWVIWQSDLLAYLRPSNRIGGVHV